LAVGYNVAQFSGLMVFTLCELQYFVIATVVAVIGGTTFLAGNDIIIIIMTPAIHPSITSHHLSIFIFIIIMIVGDDCNWWSSSL